MLRQYELVDRVLGYDPDADEALLNRAYVFSLQAHGSQKRASGDPYFSHPIEVAGILTDLHLDDETIATAILHDTIEDTVATPEQIQKLFGDNVARMVDGVTKLSKIEAQTDTERAAENLRKFLLAMSDDIRVLLVKLADRLHNMRTLHHIANPDKRKRIARETMDIYAPLAERIGMYEFMKEMQTLAFAQLEPEAYASISKRLEQLKEGGGDRIAKIGSGLKLLLSRAGRRCRHFGPREAPVQHLEEDAGAPHQLRATVRHHGVPRDRADRGGLLPRARHHPSPLADGAGAVQGLHLDAQAQRLSLAPHLGDARRRHARRNPDPHRGNARRGRIRARRALGVQDRQGPRRHAAQLDQRPGRDPRDRRQRPRSCSNTPGWRCTRIASSPSRRRASCTSCPRARRRSTSPMPSTPTSATRRSAPRSTAATCRCARSSRMATRCRSCGRRRRRRSPTGSTSRSPARRAPRSAASCG